MYPRTTLRFRLRADKVNVLDAIDALVTATQNGVRLGGNAWKEL